jgi:hypothetical protein
MDFQPDNRTEAPSEAQGARKTYVRPWVEVLATDVTRQGGPFPNNDGLVEQDSMSNGA